MRVVLRSGEPFAFAGLWSVWRDPGGNRVPSCASVTTTANDLLRPIHDRMTVILPGDLEDFWLDTSVEDADEPSSVLNPYPTDEMEAYEVSHWSTPRPMTAKRSLRGQSDAPTPWTVATKAH